ncbi:protein KRBA1 [Perognathus longimembris pacificus]|uniref:protein KRBA1 n=1 Tax=Perognathus longimembris pacificus TaxID=214514 RepID=UPI002019DB01|nr:protein KRBA1 [Perognathus longimembris pacificus]
MRRPGREAGGRCGRKRGLPPTTPALRGCAARGGPGRSHLHGSPPGRGSGPRLLPREALTPRVAAQPPPGAAPEAGSARGVASSRPGWRARLCPQAPISFKDLAVRFSEEEWRLLQEGEREFYRDVMRENYETLVSVGTAELLPLSAFLSPTEPGRAAGAESCAAGQGPPAGAGPLGGQPQHSLHLTALVQLVKEIPEFLFREVRGPEDGPESRGASLDGERASPRAAVAAEACPPPGVLTCLPESPPTQADPATTPAGSSSSSGPPGERGQGSPLPLRTADKLQPSGKEGPRAPGEEPSPPTCSPSHRKGQRRLERGAPGPGLSPRNSPLQGLVNCLKEILVPAPQRTEAALSSQPSLPPQSASKHTQVEVPGYPPWPVKTEAAAEECPLKGLLNCLKDIPEAPEQRPSPSGAGDPWPPEEAGAWKRNPGGHRRLHTPPPRPGPGAGSALAMVKVEDSWTPSPLGPASCQLGRQGYGSSSTTADARRGRVPLWGPTGQASRASSSPLEALEACLKGIPSAGPSPPQLVANSWSRSPQPGDAGPHKPELQPQGSHSEEAARDPLPPLGLRGCVREGPQGTPTSFSSTSSTDGDLDLGSPGCSQGLQFGKGYLPGSSPLQSLENCLREIPMPRLQPAWPCSSAADRGLRRMEPRSWTADKEGLRGEVCEPARLRQGGGEVPTRSLRLASPQASTSGCMTACPQRRPKDAGATRPGPWRWLQDGTATAPSPLHCLESSLKGILPAKPLRFTCLAGPGPGPSPSPCSSLSLSSSDGEDLRLEPEPWQPPLQERDRPPSCKRPLSPSLAPGGYPGGSGGSCVGAPPEGSQPRDDGSLRTGKAEEGTTEVRSLSPRGEEGAESPGHPGPRLGAGEVEATGHPRPAPRPEEHPVPRDEEEPQGLEPGHGRPSAADASQDPLGPPRPSPPPPCLCGGALQRELRSLGAALEAKLDRLATALAGLTQEVATVRTQVDRLGRRPRGPGPKPWALPRGPRWASGLGHRHLPYWRRKGPTRPKPKILRAQAEGGRAGDLQALPRGKAYLVPPLSPATPPAEPSRPGCGPAQPPPSSAPSCHPAPTGHPLLGHAGRHQSPPPPLVPAALSPLVASPATGPDAELLTAGVSQIRVPNRPKEPSSLAGGGLREDLWSTEHRDPRWGAH